MPRSVLLRHELPDRSWHYDWLIDPIGGGEPDERNLLAFRLTQRPDESPSRFTGQRLPDHRRLYLDFEGPLPGKTDRGTVRPIADWPCRIVDRNERSFELQLESARGTLFLKGRQTDPSIPDGWSFIVASGVRGAQARGPQTSDPGP